MNQLQPYKRLDEFTNSVISWDSLFSLPLWYESQHQQASPVYVKEGSKKVVISVEVPGYDKAQLDITQHATALIISGTPKPSKEDTHLKSFSYKVQLTNQYQFSGITASVENGILTVEVPKTKAAQTKKITIQ